MTPSPFLVSLKSSFRPAYLVPVSSPALRTKLGTAGRNAAQSGYSASAVIRQVEALYTSLARREAA